MDTLEILRQLRIGPFAIFDLALAYIGIYLIAPLLTKLFSRIHINISRAGWLWLTLPISVVVHLAFRQDTVLVRMLSNPQPSFYLVMIVLLGMVYMGLKDSNNPQK